MPATLNQSSIKATCSCSNCRHAAAVTGNLLRVLESKSCEASKLRETLTHLLDKKQNTTQHKTQRWAK